MKRISFFLAPLALAAVSTLPAQTTWYVRADGGTLNSPARVAAKLSAQCDGKANVAYSAAAGGHCALGDYRWLYDDQATYGVLKWIIAGGDTVIIDNAKQWRVGWDGDTGATSGWCSGNSGGPYGCFNPTIPAGTAAQPTRILGANYASCSAGTAEDKTKMTQLFGGHGIYAVLNLDGTQNVQVECLELTSHGSCAVHGSPLANDCHNAAADGGIQDYDGDGVITSNTTANVLMQDMWIHGHTDRGIIGPIGGLVTANRVNIDTNGMAGWDFDPGDGTKSVAGSTLVMHYSTVQFSGCNQEYPAVHAIPVASCYDQNSGGYGDGVGTPSDNINVAIDHSLFQYNTQDGADFGHDDIAGGTLSITSSRFIGNMGAGPKWGPGFINAVVENNYIEANSNRMQQPLAGAPTTYNQYLTDFARSGDALSWTSYDKAVLTLAGNTIVTTSPTTFDMQCGTNGSVQSCNGTVFNIADNIVLAYDDPATYPFGGQAGGPGLYCGAGCNSSTAPIGTINRQNNIYYGLRGACAANVATGSLAGTVIGESCADPLLTAEPAKFTTEAALDGVSFTPSSSSPLTGHGVSVAGLLTDYNGTARPTPPSIGAVEGTGTPVASTPVPVPTPTPAAPVVTTWTKVTGEGATVTLPAGTIYRYGAAGGYTATLTAATATTFGVNNGTFGGDPDPNVVKELDVSGSGAGVIVNGVAFAVAVPATTCNLAGYTTTAVPGYKLALCQ